MQNFLAGFVDFHETEFPEFQNLSLFVGRTQIEPLNQGSYILSSTE